jgi:hypothetical protein
MFFPFFPCCNPEQPSFKQHQQRQLSFLKMMRSSMETRLAALNAAIGNLESQLSQDET